MSLTKQLAAGFVLGVMALQLLSMTKAGKTAYWQRVKPVVAKYEEALSW